MLLGRLSLALNPILAKVYGVEPPILSLHHVLLTALADFDDINWKTAEDERKHAIAKAFSAFAKAVNNHHPTEDILKALARVEEVIKISYTHMSPGEVLQKFCIQYKKLGQPETDLIVENAFKYANKEDLLVELRKLQKIIELLRRPKRNVVCPRL